MQQTATILLIEPDTSLRRLITLGLEQRGLHVVGLSTLAALDELPIATPDLLVLDIENDCQDDAALLADVQAHPYLGALPMLVLTWDAQDLPVRRTLPLLDYVAKPFDARKLHANIENLLETSADIAKKPSEINLTAAISAPSASLCPLLTAGGLLLTVVGLMLMQMVLVGAGLLLVLVGLLWWTLGKRPEQRVVLESISKQHYIPISSSNG